MRNQTKQDQTRPDTHFFSSSSHAQSFVLRHLICESLPSPVRNKTRSAIMINLDPEPEHSTCRGWEYIRNVLPQLISNHLLSDQNILVRLAIVHGEPQADEVREDCSGALLRPDRGCARRRGECAGEGKAGCDKDLLVFPSGIHVLLRFYPALFCPFEGIVSSV
ncbi:hypothetical protein BJX63DRAFT_223988 [Aspergillus granulosus]|uniref:Uncharacterized protein n=1 Tax=Aspergillus granulosus TaxID=176169 RepID=A0ABR4I234_9EURO